VTAPKTDRTIQGVPCKAGKPVWFHKNGELKSATLSKNTDIDRGTLHIPCKGMKEVEFYADGGFKSLTLLRSVRIGKYPCKSMTKAEFHSNGGLKKFTLSGAKKIYNHSKLNFAAGETLEFGKDGGLLTRPPRLSEKDFRRILKEIEIEGKLRAVRATLKGLDIVHLNRIKSAKVLNEIIRNRIIIRKNDNRKNIQKIDRRPLLLVFYPKVDHNGAFKISTPLLDKIIKRFQLVYFEVNSVQQMIQYFKKTTRYKKASVVIVAGHGTQTTLQFGIGSELKVSDRKELQKAELHKGLEKHPVIILDSCDNGKGGRKATNLANMMAKVLPQGRIESMRISPNAPSFLFCGRHCITLEMSASNKYIVYPFTISSRYSKLVLSYRNGRAKKIDLKVNMNIQKIPCRRGTVLFHSNGRLKQVTLAKPHKIGHRKLRAGSIVTFNRNGRFLRLIKAVKKTVPSKPTITIVLQPDIIVQRNLNKTIKFANRASKNAKSGKIRSAEGDYKWAKQCFNNALLNLSKLSANKKRRFKANVNNAKKILNAANKAIVNAQLQ